MENSASKRIKDILGEEEYQKFRFQSCMGFLKTIKADNINSPILSSYYHDFTEQELCEAFIGLKEGLYEEPLGFEDFLNNVL